MDEREFRVLMKHYFFGEKEIQLILKSGWMRVICALRQAKQPFVSGLLFFVKSI